MSKHVAIAVVAAVVAACHESSPPAPAAGPPAAPVARAAPRPAPSLHDFGLGPGLEMRRPIRDGHLTIIPIALTGSTPAADVLSLGEGMRRKLVTVRDIGSYTEVRVRNRSRQPLFVMAGEIVLGGEQDHAFAETRVIAAGDTVTLQVYCIEQGRSRGGHKFRSGHALVDAGLRRIMRFGDQQQVWRAVDEINRKLDLSPPTRTYRDAAALQDQGERAERRARLIAQLADPQLVGLAAAYDGEVIAVDHFTTPVLFRDHVRELVGSYVAGDDGTPHEGAAPIPDDVRRLAAAPDARRVDPSFEALARPRS